MIKLLIGGSPCTFWSIAQKNGRETEAEGLGWELFKNFLIAKEKFKPDLFLYENNKSASQAIKDQIACELGVGTDPNARFTYINSALVSAQNRHRFYVTNFGDIEQPEDRGILLKDILESGTTDREKSRAVICSIGRTTHREYFQKAQGTMAIEPVNMLKSGKARCVTAGYANQGAKHILESNYSENPHKQTWDSIAEPVCVAQRGRWTDNGSWEQNYEAREDGKTNAITTVQKDNAIAEPVRIGGLPRPNGELSTSQAMRLYSVDGKSVNLTSNGGGLGAKTGLYAIPVCHTGSDNEPYYAVPVEWDENGIPTKAVSGADGKIYTVYEVKNGQITINDKTYPIKLQDGYYIIRKLTPIECERLQTLPDNYTAAVSASQRYKALGNGWTAEVIIHLLNHALKDIPKDEEIIVLSMYDGIGTGRYCLDKMGFTNVKYYAYEIDKYPKQIAMSNYPDIIQMGDAFNIRHPDWTIGY